MPDLIETAEVESEEAEAAEADPVEADELEAAEPETTEPEAAEDEIADAEAAGAEPAEVETRDVADAVAEAPAPDVAIADIDTVEIDVVEVDGSGESEESAPPVEAAKPASPYDLPGDWYVIHSYSGYENKVKANLETRIQSMHMGDRIFEVHIPMEDVVEFKAGKKVTVPKKVFAGYILVRMTLDDDSWYAVRNTPGVTGFVAGNAQKPTPLSRREVERFLGVQEEEEKAKPRFKPEWEVGEQVRVVTGPFADFNGVIEDMNVDQQKVVVLVNIFGRDTPVELGFEDIQKS
ncbi:MAG TPA: transcription termination/antitermination protein NusG [Acidimicrobiia bacterium]|nr:transcription termination/antitermination protein NusG [Acidimicrobiia bacterium]